jgi:DNA repair exonuclease SbcCD nuclease subunit
MENKKIIAIASSDWHINNWPAFNIDNRRLFLSLDQFRLISRLCKKYKVPHLFCGDLFHKPKELDNEVITLASKFFKQYFEDKAIHFIGISGNHDQSRKNYTDAKSPSYLDKFGLIFNNFSQADFCNVALNENTDIWGIPYLHHNIGFIETVKNFKQQFKKPKNILLIHTDLYGAKDTDNRIVGSVDNIPENMKKAFRGFDLVLSGHIHKPQKIDKNIFMLGALQQHSRKDKNCEMGYWEIYDDMSALFKPLTCYPQFKEYAKGTDKPDEFHFYDEVTTVLTLSNEATNEVVMNTTMSRDSLIEAYSKIENMDTKKKSLLTRILNTIK